MMNKVIVMGFQESIIKKKIKEHVDKFYSLIGVMYEWQQKIIREFVFDGMKKYISFSTGLPEDQIDIYFEDVDN